MYLYSTVPSIYCLLVYNLEEHFFLIIFCVVVFILLSLSAVRMCSSFDKFSFCFVIFLCKFIISTMLVFFSQKTSIV